MNFIIYNKEKFSNFMYTQCQSKNKHYILRANASLYCFQKNTFYAGIKIFNSEIILKKDKAKFNAA